MEVIYNGLVNGESPSVLSGTIAWGGSAQGAVNVGAYTIIPSNLTSPNYTINYINGTLTITQEPITITANGQTKFIGSPDPALTYQVTSGTVYAGSALSGTPTRAGGEVPGAYPISRGTLTSPNYAITFVDSTLFIEANPAGMVAPSTVTTTTNTLPTVSVYFPGSNAPPFAAGTGGSAVDINQPTLKIVMSKNGKNIILESVPRRRR